MSRSLVEACNRVVNDLPKKRLDVPIVEPKELAVIDEKPVEVMQYNGFELGQIEGEIGVLDLTFPRLNIAQAVSEYAQKNKFETGCLVLKKEIKLCGPGEPLIFSVLRLRTYYEEQLAQYNPNIPLQRFDKLTEVTAAGLSLAAGTARNVADVYLLIECPRPELSVHFPIVIGEKNFSIAIWTVRKSSYRKVVRTILTENALSKKSLMAFRWKCVVQVEKLGQIMAGVPYITVLSLNTPEDIANITTALKPS
jgi:hypothetical protein